MLVIGKASLDFEVFLPEVKGLRMVVRAHSPCWFDTVFAAVLSYFEWIESVYRPAQTQHDLPTPGSVVLEVEVL